MSEPDPIHEALERVFSLRTQAAESPELATALSDIKALQAHRFQRTYSDLLRSPVFGDAARFFLQDLYGERDFTGRDEQFARISGTISRLFPQSVVETAVALAELHALTEELDLAMARAWLRQESSGAESRFQRYALAWKFVGRPTDREHQLASVQQIGRSMIRLTKTPGLRLMLKMMRRPAHAAGLGALQEFLERGFDTFHGLHRPTDAAQEFLEIIQGRESALLEQLFDCDPARPETALAELFQNS